MAAGKPTHKWKRMENQMVRVISVTRKHRNKSQTTATNMFSGLTFSMAITYTGWPKKLAPFLYALTLPNNTDFHNYFTVGIRRKFVITQSLKIPPHLKCGDTLPCEMSSVCRSVSLIAPLVSGVAGLSASYSSSSKADTIFEHCKNCRM